MEWDSEGNSDVMISCAMNVQVKIPGLQSRFYHSSAAFNLSPRLAEVTIFGGCPEWPVNVRSATDLSSVANTFMLRFGECFVIRECISTPYLGLNHRVITIFQL